VRSSTFSVSAFVLTTVKVALGIPRTPNLIVPEWVCAVPAEGVSVHFAYTPRVAAEAVVGTRKIATAAITVRVLFLAEKLPEPLTTATEPPF